MSTREQTRSPAVEDYCKAIFTLESRSDEPVSTNALAERLAITPGSVSAMLKRLDELGLIAHLPYRGVRLTDDGAGRAGGHPPPPAAGAVPRRDAGDALGSRARRGRGARARDLRGARAADRRQARRSRRSTRTATRSPAPSWSCPSTRRTRWTACGRASRVLFVRVSDADPEMLRYLSERGIAPGDRVLVPERQPFGGPLLVSFADGEREQAHRRTARARDAGELDRRRRPARRERAPQRIGRRRAARQRRGDRTGGGGREGVSRDAGAPRSGLEGAGAGAARVLPAGAPRADQPSGSAAGEGPDAGDADDARARRSSRRSPTSIRATSPRTSRAARGSATCCCGSCSSRT